jgi:hypothetical protein
MEDRLAMRRGIDPAIQIARRALAIQTRPPGTRLSALRLSGSRTVSAALTGATGSGAHTEPWWSIMAMTVSPC